MVNISFSSFLTDRLPGLLLYPVRITREKACWVYGYILSISHESRITWFIFFLFLTVLPERNITSFMVI